MSKDKGTKNVKKAPADKSTKNKATSDYKSESKSKDPSLGAFVPKTDGKAGGATKNK